MPLHNDLLPPLRVTITNLYDAHLVRRGQLEETRARSILVLGPVVDLCVLSLTPPAEVVEFLGLAEGRAGTDRLFPVELTIRDRTCSIDAFRSTDDRVVIGHVALTALGLKLDPELGVVEDPYPGR